jgi:O-methyltransferase domain/Dimerisation domain
MTETKQSTPTDLSHSAAMLQMIAGFRISRAIYVAANLRLADLVQDGPKSSEELAEATGTHAPSLYRIMRVLASAGIFAQDEEDLFSLTPLAATLRSDIPGSLRASALTVMGDEAYRTWGEIMHTLRTGEPAFGHVHGMDIWQYRAKHPEAAKIFDQTMANNMELFKAAVLAKYPFSTFKNIVDVGGGDGSFLISVLKANPDMKGVLFDLPHVAEKAQQRIIEAGLSTRCEVVGGDVFTGVPPGGDAYVLSRVVSSFENERAIAILKTCRRVMGAKSKLLLLHLVLPDRVEASSLSQAAIVMDLAMMVNTGGRERTEAEHRDLLAASGFQLTQIVPTESEMSVVECVPI